MTETLRERQIALEHECVAMGQTAYEAALESGGVDETAPGRRLLKMAVEPTALLIEKFVEASQSGKAGRKHSALPYVVLVDPLQAAYLTARAALNGAGTASTAQLVAMNVASNIEDHLNLCALAKKHPGLYRKVSEQLRKSTSASHRKGVYARVMSKYAGKELSWGRKERLLLGMKLLELFIEATDMVFLAHQTRESSKDTPMIVTMRDEWNDILRKAHDQCALLSPHRLPMIVPPRRWEHPYAGGYLTEVMHTRLVRTRSREYLDELGSVVLTDVLNAVNIIQATPWKINKAVLAVVSEMWEHGMESPALPPRNDPDLPPLPVGLVANLPLPQQPLEIQEAMRGWKARASKVHEARHSLRGERVQLSQKLHVARRFENEEAVYFPHSLDFRGRVYPLPNYINPQGDDVAKGLLLFHEGKPLGDTGGFWLAVHIANLFGVDKVSFDERVAWVLENEEKLLDSAVDPLGGLRFWESADSPFCALAACFEWAGFKFHGDAFVSHLPVAMDGSCSGLQHFSALLRDAEGGAAVNLVPSDKPADIYTKVAKRAQALSDESASEYSSVWSNKFSRKIAKQPTMTICYSATVFGMQKQIEDALNKLDEGGKYLPGDGENHHAAGYAAGVVWKAIGDTVHSAQSAMVWLQTIAKVLARAGMPLRWTTPMGLPVLQEYRVMESERFNVFVDSERVQLRLSAETSRMDVRRQASGIAPNFVHSLDSSHLMSTAVLASLNGIKSLAVIHDSFGTHACDTDTLHAVIRESFVQQYTPDLLTRFRDEVVEQLEASAPHLVKDIPPVPPFGTLDISKVREADYLFA